MKRKRHVLLADLVKQNDLRYGAEVGVLSGSTTFHLLDSCYRLRMYAVDKWEQFPPDDILGKFDMAALYDEIVKRKTDYGPRLTILRGESVEMAKRVEDGFLDFVFIDADHSSESVAADIAAWSPKVKAGGFIGGHDIDLPSVHDVVSRTYRHYRTLDDDVWMVQKNG